MKLGSFIVRKKPYSKGKASVWHGFVDNRHSPTDLEATIDSQFPNGFTMHYEAVIEAVIVEAIK